MTIPPLIGLVAAQHHARHSWQHALHHAGVRVLVCPGEQMTAWHPTGWVVVPPVHMPPDPALAALPLNAPTLVITPWIAETHRLVREMYQPLIVAHPDRVRRDMRRYLTILTHVAVGVLAVPGAGWRGAG